MRLVFGVDDCPALFGGDGRRTRRGCAVDVEAIAMSELDRVWQKARSDLMVATVTGDPDSFLWEHSSRIARAACAIARLECVQRLDPDLSAVAAAALYHDAGWVAGFHSGEVDRCEILVRTPPVRANQDLRLLIQ